MVEGTYKKVLVEHDDDSFPVSFVSGESESKAIKEKVAAQLALPSTDLILKIQSEELGGRWVNIGEGDIIPDKAVIRPAKVCWQWDKLCTFCSLLSGSRQVHVLLQLLLPLELQQA